MKVFVVVLLILLNACSPCDQNIMQVLFSDDKTVVVNVVQESCGSTVEYGHDVIIDAVDSSWFSKTTVFRSLGAKNLHVQWIESNRLKISYDDAHILEFTNRWWTRNVPSGSATVRIIEVQNQ